MGKMPDQEEIASQIDAWLSWHERIEPGSREPWPVDPVDVLQEHGAVIIAALRAQARALRACDHEFIVMPHDGEGTGYECQKCGQQRVVVRASAPCHGCEEKQVDSYFEEVCAENSELYAKLAARDARIELDRIRILNLEGIVKDHEEDIAARNARIARLEESLADERERHSAYLDGNECQCEFCASALAALRPGDLDDG